MDNPMPWKFMQDGAPPHRPQAVKDFIRAQGHEIHEHPANSPDFNPIETIWGWMKQDIEVRNPGNKQRLEDAIFNSWESLSLTFIRNVIDHLRSYLTVIVNIEGGWPARNVV